MNFNSHLFHIECNKNCASIHFSALHSMELCDMPNMDLFSKFIFFAAWYVDYESLTTLTDLLASVDLRIMRRACFVLFGGLR